MSCDDSIIRVLLFLVVWALLLLIVLGTVVVVTDIREMLRNWRR